MRIKTTVRTPGLKRLAPRIEKLKRDAEAARVRAGRRRAVTGIKQEIRR